MVLARSAGSLDRGSRVRPMLARAGPYPADPSSFAFEPKWDGIRALAHVAGGRAAFFSRTGNDVTAQFPELASFGDTLPVGRWVFDGEVVAPDEDGVPRFQRIQSRLGVTKPGQLRYLVEEVPVVFVVFDVLVAAGRDVTILPYTERRALLEGLHLRGPSWFVTPASVGDGEGFLALTDWEGVMAKRLSSRYEPGARSAAWIKIRRAPRQEFVVGGWTRSPRARS